jgi:diguanylate cyclase (GGDEF)-like protein
MGFVFDVFGGVMFQQDHVGQLILDVLIIITIYALFFGPLSSKITASLLISAKTIYMLIDHVQIRQDSGSTIIMSILIANVLGFYSWKAITIFRRQQYAIQSELEEARKKAEYLARIDPLTCLNNRRAFMEYGQDEFSRSIRHQRTLSMVMIDIDDFKPINDKFGHQMGDEVLKLFSQTVYKQIRAQDIFGRIGGDEFGLLFPETNLQEAQLITDRLCRLFCQETLTFQNATISPSFSAGIAAMDGADQSFEQLLQRADQKLYLAKQAGKHRVEV